MQNYYPINYQPIWGSLYENLVAQMIAASGRELYYHTWEKEEITHYYQVDFLISEGSRINVFEVKSSGTGKEQAELTRRIQVNVQFKTEEEVEKAFQILTKDGEIVRNLVKPPYMVMIGEARDKFGVHWVLMCNFH